MDLETREGRPASLTRQFPWLRLSQGVGMAFDARSLILASLGLILLWIGWAALDAALGFDPIQQVMNPRQIAEFTAGRWDDLRDPYAVAEPYLVLIRPFANLFRVDMPLRAFLASVLACLWAVVVWGIIGGSIARIAAVRVATGERIGIGTAVRFALKRGMALVGAPLSPMIGVGFFVGLCALMGLLYQIPGTAGPFIAGILAFLPLLAGLVMALILIGVAVGWPLMVATVSVEGEDIFDALSRSYSYVFQRPAYYGFLVALAWGAGWIGRILATLFAALVVQLAVWSLAFGGPDARVVAAFNPPFGSVGPVIGAHGFWIYVVRLLAHAWIYSFFWTSAAIIYLLLREEVDGASIHNLATPDAPPESFVPEKPIPTGDV